MMDFNSRHGPLKPPTQSSAEHDGQHNLEPALEDESASTCQVLVREVVQQSSPLSPHETPVWGSQAARNEPLQTEGLTC